MNRLGLVVILTLATAGPALAQGSGLPSGKWWRKPEVVQQLALSQEQQQKLDSTFRAAASQLIDLKADVEKRSIELRGELDQPQLNRQDIQRLAIRLNEARGKLFERELMMMVDMRGMLNDDQWSKLRNAMADQEGPGGGRGMMRRQQGGMRRDRPRP